MVFQLLYVAGQKGWNEPLQEAESELILDIDVYDYFVAKDHIAFQLRRPTRERVTTILTGFRSARIWAIKGTGFQQGNIRDGQTFQGHATQHESFGTYAKPSEKRAKKGFKKISQDFNIR